MSRKGVLARLLGQQAVGCPASLNLLLSVFAQKLPVQGVMVGGDSSQVGNINVHAVYANGNPGGRQVWVCLMSGSSSTIISESFTNEQGAAQFVDIPIGEYHVIVSGEGIQESDSGEFELDRRKISQSILLLCGRPERVLPNKVSKDSPQFQSRTSDSCSCTERVRSGHQSNERAGLGQSATTFAAGH